MTKKTTTIHLGEDDRAALETIRDYHGLTSLAAAIRLSARAEARRIEARVDQAKATTSGASSAAR